MPKRLVVEGWRCSSHSYALVNQHQLLQWMSDPRFSVSHIDVPFFRPEWARIDAGFPPSERAALEGLQPPPSGESPDITYRISWPLRIHGGEGNRVLVFATSEVGSLPPGSICGPSGTEEGVDVRAVELVTASRWSKQCLLALGFSPEQVHIVPHGVDGERFQPAPATPEERQRVRAALDIADEAFVFLNVGAMTWNKGIGPLLAAFARHRRANKQSFLVLKGGDALYGSRLAAAVEEASRLGPEVKDEGVAAAVRYVPGNLSQAALAALYRSADAYVSPYRAEGFNLPVLEALACGLPAAVTAGGATDDFCSRGACLQIDAQLVDRGETRHLEPSVDSIIERMQQMVDSRSERLRAARERSEDIRRQFSWRAVTARLSDLMLGTA